MKENTKILKGLVIRASRSIITVRTETEDKKIKEFECRIKGKILKGNENYYNPLAPGDMVIIEHDIKSGASLVLSVEERKNFFSRFNQKEKKSQLLAANVDLVLCVCSPVSPPFRPRFIDRLLLQSDAAGIEAIVIVNKTDLEYNNIDIDERLENYKTIGYRVLPVSARTREGLSELKQAVNGKLSVLAGQSGVGKSSLINALNPGLNLKEGAINEKYNRGVHTTTMSFIADIDANTRLIDTPGIRLFIPDLIKPDDIIYHMKEFSALAGKCSFGSSCSHKTEVGCKIMEAVAAGIIHEDRYESFLRIREDVKEYYNEY